MNTDALVLVAAIAVIVVIVGVVVGRWIDRQETAGEDKEEETG